MRKTVRRIICALRPLATAAVLLSGLATVTGAHEIPSDVVVRAYLKVDQHELKLLVRVPLEAMRDVVLPLRGPGYLQIGEAEQVLRDAATIWIANQVELYEGGRRLGQFDLAATRVALPSDRSFSNYDSAHESVRSEPLPDSTELMWGQALLDVLLVFPIESSNSDFSIKPNFERLGLRTTTVLRFISGTGTERPFEFVGDPGLIRLDPRWHYAFFRFVALGFEHILDGVDHLLFVLCLIIPVRRLRPLIVIITSFTVAHSVTLLSSAFGFVPNVLWFPPLIETLIAASIVYMALENIVAGNLRRRWMIAFAFGLVHGFGFAFALSETLQFAGSHLLTSLLAFNLGVELGQLFVIVLAAPVIHLLFRHVMPERIGIIVLSALLAHSGWHWMSERAAILSAYSIRLPVLAELPFASVLRWAAFLLVIAVVLYLMGRLYKRVVVDDGSFGEKGSRDTG
ncbi:MAG: HupE/UreJ family protein [Gammaproteobacteria bacterium]|nr:HupE/UreJ family protein [Gammaproteobacteria bacterium]